MNGIFQQEIQPTNVTNGDIWVDTGNQQLKIFNGTDFVLVGPGYSSSTRTGTYSTTIYDIYNQPHNVIINYINDVPVTIISSEGFTPNPVIYGFSTIYAGTNVSSSNIGTIADPVYAKMNGLAEVASYVRTVSPVAETVPADSLVRNDVSQRMNGPLSIVNDNGTLKLGVDSTFILQRKNQYNANFYNTFPDSGTFTFDFLVSGVSKTVLSIIGGTQSVGINSVAPVATLDVGGTLRSTGKVSFADTSEYTLAFPTAASVNIAGGVHVSKNLGIDGVLYVNSGSVFSSSIASTGLMPVSDNTSDVGSSLKAWNTVFGTVFQGGVATGGMATFTGIATKATQLTVPRVLTVSGDVAGDSKTFDGSSNVSFVTTAQTSLIYNRASTSTTTINDTVMVYRPATVPDTGNGTLYKQNKASFLKDVNYVTPAINTVTPNSTPCGSLVPIGSVITYAIGVAPTGWLLCDGSDYPPISYPELYSMIGTTFGTVGSNFRVPSISPIPSAGGGNLYYIIKY